MNRAQPTIRAAFALVLALALPTPPARADGTRQLATGGATMIEGSAGGGIVPWAVIAGYANREEIGGTAFATRVDTGDYRMTSTGFALGFHNRVELSFARQTLDLVTLGPALGLPGAELEQDVVGLKLRLAGDAVYTRMPQISLGAQYKRNRDFGLPRALGAGDDAGIDLYLAVSKVFLAGAGGYNAFAHGTLRWTEANETGLLGFGGPDGGRHLEAEAALGVLFNRHLALGVEYRTKSGNLAGLPEDDWADVFLAWFPNRNLSVVLAWVDLGTIATLDGQTGWYASIEGSF